MAMLPLISEESADILYASEVVELDTPSREENQIILNTTSLLDRDTKITIEVPQKLISTGDELAMRLINSQIEQTTTTFTFELSADAAKDHAQRMSDEFTALVLINKATMLAHPDSPLTAEDRMQEMFKIRTSLKTGEFAISNEDKINKAAALIEQIVAIPRTKELNAAADRLRNQLQGLVVTALSVDATGAIPDLEGISAAQEFIEMLGTDASADVCANKLLEACSQYNNVPTPAETATVDFQTTLIVKRILKADRFSRHDAYALEGLPDAPTPEDLSLRDYTTLHEARTYEVGVFPDAMQAEPIIFGNKPLRREESRDIIGKDVLAVTKSVLIANIIEGFGRFELPEDITNTNRQFSENFIKNVTTLVKEDFTPEYAEILTALLNVTDNINALIQDGQLFSYEDAYRLFGTIIGKRACLMANSNFDLFTEAPVNALADPSKPEGNKQSYLMAEALDLLNKKLTSLKESSLEGLTPLQKIEISYAVGMALYAQKDCDENGIVVFPHIKGVDQMYDEKGFPKEKAKKK